MGAPCPRELAVPAAPQAGLNNRTAKSHTLSPAEKKQAVPAPPDPLRTFDGPAFYGRACLGWVLIWLVRLSLTLPSA